MICRHYLPSESCCYPAPIPEKCWDKVFPYTWMTLLLQVVQLCSCLMGKDWFTVTFTSHSCWCCHFCVQQMRDNINSVKSFPGPKAAWFDSGTITADKQLLDKRWKTLANIISVSWFRGYWVHSVLCLSKDRPGRCDSVSVASQVTPKCCLLLVCDCSAEHYQHGGGWLQSPSLKKLPGGWSPMFYPIDFFNALHIHRQDSTDETG